ncbi:MAG: FecR domain-containing protein [Spirochaetia bacterium]|nr:FecR domain-containing protein [Spirochaetia bacterium]
MKLQLFILPLYLTLLIFPLTCGPSNLKKTGKNIPTSAIVLFVFGDVKTGDARIKTGDLLHSGTEVVVGRKSGCDLQVRDADSSIMIRLHENTSYQLTARLVGKTTEFKSRLDHGMAQFRIDKMTTSEQVKISTPTSIASVRGTRFDMQVDSTGNTKTTVYEGAVAARPSIQELDDLPPDLIARSLTFDNAVTSLDKHEKVIEAGMTLTIEKKDSDALLESSPKLKTVLENPEIKELRRKTDLTPEQAQKAASSVDISVSEEKREEMKRSLEKGSVNKPKKIDEDEMKKNLKLYDNMIAIEKNKLETQETASQAVKERNAASRTQIMERISEIMHKPVESLKLKNGKILNGVILQQGADFVVLTPEGRQLVRSSEVAEFKF